MIRFLLAALLALATTDAYAQAGCPAGVSIACFASLNDGPVAPGAAAGKSSLAGAVYNSSPPTLTNGQQAAIQVDAAGRVYVVIGAGSVSLTGTLPAFAATPTVNVGALPPLPTGTNAIGAITNTSFAATQSGTYTVQPGNTVNTTPWLASINAGGNTATVAAASTAAAAANPALVVTTSPNSAVPLRTLVTLDIKFVTTGGVAVTVLNAGNRKAGGWLQNPSTATVNLCINEIGTATGTTSSGDTTCVTPGQTYMLAPSGNAVSVITADNAHSFSGMGWQ